MLYMAGANAEFEQSLNGTAVGFLERHTG